MLFDNPIFENWYTDSMSISRNVSYKVGNVDKKRREEIYKDIRAGSTVQRGTVLPGRRQRPQLRPQIKWPVMCQWI